MGMDGCRAARWTGQQPKAEKAVLLFYYIVPGGTQGGVIAK